MPAAISRFPKGLLALLASQNLGETPRVLGDAVAPVLDMRDFYLLNEMQAALGTDAAPALGSRTFTAGTSGFIDLSQPVPANEVWFLHEYHLTASPGAATGVTLQPRLSASNASMCFSVPQVVTGIAGSPPVFVPSGFPRMWLPPGTRFTYLVNAITGAPGTIEGVAWVSRFGSST